MLPFQYHRAEDAETALQLLQQSGAMALAGGTSLLDLMKLGVETPLHVVDIRDLPWKEITAGSSTIAVGALCSNAYVADHPLVGRHFPAVSQSILSGASGQIRNMATVGGNILERTRCYYFYDAAARCNKRERGTGWGAIDGFNRIHAILGAAPHCGASHPPDMCVALAALGAIVH